jgi:Nickel responsive protein SCO4226-like
MPLFLDSHILPEGMTADDVAEIHAKDLAVQASHGVQMVKYWYDAARGRVFCLVVAPSRDAAVAVHRESSGLEPDDIFEVQEFE